MLPLPPASSGSPAARARRHAAAYAEALQGEFGKVQLAVISECISKTGSAELFYARYLQFRRDALVEMIAAGQTDGSILAEGAPEDLYDAIYGSLFYRYVFGIAPITPAYARNLVDLVLRLKELSTSGKCEAVFRKDHARNNNLKRDLYRTGLTGAEILSVRSRSDMSTTVSIGAVNS